MFALYNGLAVLVFVLERRESLGTFDDGFMPLQKSIAVYPALYAALGLCLLRGAPGLERFCYPKKETVADENEFSGG